MCPLKIKEQCLQNFYFNVIYYFNIIYYCNIIYYSNELLTEISVLDCLAAGLFGCVYRCFSGGAGPGNSILKGERLKKMLEEIHPSLSEKLKPLGQHVRFSYSGGEGMERGKGGGSP